MVMPEVVHISDFVGQKTIAFALGIYNLRRSSIPNKYPEGEKSFPILLEDMTAGLLPFKPLEWVLPV